MQELIKEAYLTEKQIQDIDGQPVVFGQDRGQEAKNVAKRLCESRYFPLYDNREMSGPAAFYFTRERVILPTGANELAKKMRRRQEECEDAEEYIPASHEQVKNLHAYLDRFIRTDGTVTEPLFEFLSSAECLIYGPGWQYQFPIGKEGGFALPVWDYSLDMDQSFPERWLKMKKEYGLFPMEKEISRWLDTPRTQVLTEAQYKKIKDQYIEADYLRLGKEYYRLSAQMLENGDGCWEVYEKGIPDTGKIHCTFPKKQWLRACAPAESIVKGGSVSIDFGTKSTVVVIYNPTQNSVYPYTTYMRKAGEEDVSPLFPTVLGFANLKKFLEDYQSEPGRPYTDYKTLSIDVPGRDRKNPKSDLELGTFRKLKQWMLDQNTKGAILKQKEFPDDPVILRAYGSEENSVDPIELYAYYLGLNINNNRDNQIFMEYRLSFSEACPESIRGKMRESFERGIKKSLPSSIVKDQYDVMRDFSVKCVCSEPAAYAVCALACMGIPARLKRLYYGIFDFGGGTCDFNYGSWEVSRDKLTRRNRYQIWMYGSGGDPLLGGENILELLAVQVCIEAEDYFKKKGCKINRPICYEGGNKNFFASSFEAAYNLEVLVEEIRKVFWENPNKENGNIVLSNLGLLPEKASEKRKDGNVNPSPQKVSGQNMDGNVGDKVDCTHLENCVKERIMKGVRAFFNTFYRMLREQALSGVSEFCIFLAGNSCRSRWVRESFHVYIEKELNHDYIEKVYLFDPIGTPEFEQNIPSELWDDDERAQMKEKIDHLKNLDGKTGVAYGLSLYGNQVEIGSGSGTKYLSHYLGVSVFMDYLVVEGERGDRLQVGECALFASNSICNLFYTEMPPQNGRLGHVKPILLNGLEAPKLEDGQEWACFVGVCSETEICIFTAPVQAPGERDSRKDLIFDLKLGRFK